ncbi:hypothetical protein [Thalassospira sp.]|uniref:hypothetical protein n=1 Tax=Thalassospira sp. TaxID=1912094 RepID=UPI0032EC1D7B
MSDAILVTSRFFNMTNMILNFECTESAHGAWGERPASQLQPYQELWWNHHSNGIMTGSEAGVIVTSGDTFLANFSWDVPYLGENTFQAHISGQSNYYAEYWGQQASDVHVVYWLRPKV